jgi:hypothetical protein
MFESNIPVDKGSYSYPVFWNACKLLAKGAADAERADFFPEQQLASIAFDRRRLCKYAPGPAVSKALDDRVPAFPWRPRAVTRLPPHFRRREAKSFSWENDRAGAQSGSMATKERPSPTEAPLTTALGQIRP